MNVAPLYDLRSEDGIMYAMCLCAPFLGSLEREIERRVNAFSKRTGLSLSQICIVKSASGVWFPQWNDCPEDDGFLRTSGNPQR